MKKWHSFRCKFCAVRSASAIFMAVVALGSERLGIGMLARYAWHHVLDCGLSLKPRMRPPGIQK